MNQIIGLMSLNRELKRVPLDFDWELKKTWKGYQNPFYKKCLVCDGRCITKAREELEDVVGSLVYSHTRGINELTLALADKKPEELSPFGFSGTDVYHITLKILKLAGLPEKWGWCPICKGEGIDTEVRKEYDNWKKYEPPKGEGYQCWETISEGSPISLVFKTFNELCKWLSDNPTGTTKKFTEEDWKKALRSDASVIEMETGKLR